MSSSPSLASPTQGGRRHGRGSLSNSSFRDLSSDLGLSNTRVQRSSASSVLNEDMEIEMPDLKSRTQVLISRVLGSPNLDLHNEALKSRGKDKELISIEDDSNVSFIPSRTATSKRKKLMDNNLPSSSSRPRRDIEPKKYKG
jgi:hypothetical protein